MWNKSLNIFAEKMNYNYILHKLILCILGYMFWNNTRQMLQKTQVIPIQKTERVQDKSETGLEYYSPNL